MTPPRRGALAQHPPAAASGEQYVKVTVVEGSWPTLRSPDENEVLDTEEAAKLLRVSTKTVLRLAGDGELPGRKVGRAWRFRRGDVLAWLSSQDSTP